jgi:hypothetical protein
MAMKNFAAAALILLGFASCKRKGEPEPKICTDKNDYRLTDTIRLTNCSENYTGQRWLLPDGTQSTASSVYFVPQAPIAYTFRLFVTDEDFVQEYQAIREITVAP